MTRKLLVAASLVIFVAACDNQPSQSPSGTAAAAESRAPASFGPPPATDGADGPGPALPEAQPTAADLIEAAVAAGTIDDATGLLYRVFARFGDPRLPAEFSTGRADEDVVALMRAPAEIDSLPADIAAAIRPFIARPTDPASVLYDVTVDDTPTGTVTPAAYHPASGSTAIVAAPSVTCDPRTHWGSAIGSQRLKVWGRCGDPASDAAIQATVGFADALWVAERAYLGGQREPLEDLGNTDHGGDTRIDIYLVSNCWTRDQEQFCLNGDTGMTPSSKLFHELRDVKVSSAFILIDRRRVGDPVALQDSLAHELFHAFQYAFNQGGFTSGAGAAWFLDASAAWAEWRFVPAGTERFIVPLWAGFQSRRTSLQDPGAANAYDSFAWPLFMEQDGGDGTVARAWQSLIGQPNQAAIMDAIDGVISFESKFRIFGMRGWNKEMTIDAPVTPWLPPRPTSYANARLGPLTPKSPATIELVGTDKGATPRSLPGGSESLWAHYQHFKVKDDVGQVVLDFTGVTPASRLDVDALVKIKGRSQWERKELPDGKTTWCIDNPDEAVEEFVIVLSNHAHVLGETLSGTWTVDSPKEPCLSYHIVIKWTEIFDGVPDPFVFDGYADTINPDALGGQVMLTGSGTYSGSRSGYIGCNPGLEGSFPAHGAGTATFQAIIVGDRVTVNAFADFNSTFAGVSTWPLEGPREGTFDASLGAETPVETSGPLVGDLCPRSWTISATWEVKIKPPP